MDRAMPAARKPNSADRLKKMQIAMYLDIEQLEALRALSGKTRVPMQAYLREGLEYVLNKHGRTEGARK
jgi:hypothetical protein